MRSRTSLRRVLVNAGSDRAWHRRRGCASCSTGDRRTKASGHPILRFAQDMVCCSVPASSVCGFITTMKYWLMKSEPSAYSIDDLKRDKTTSWNGVRNYQARNYMRDEIRPPFHDVLLS